MAARGWISPTSATLKDGDGVLEFHHVLPYADGSENVAHNLELGAGRQCVRGGAVGGTLFARESTPRS
jgi:hypothetical protein